MDFGGGDGCWREFFCTRILRKNLGAQKYFKRCPTFGGLSNPIKCQEEQVIAQSKVILKDLFTRISKLQELLKYSKYFKSYDYLKS
jgi:hypothetical protein